MANKGLIIIDMLNDFIHEEGALYCGPSAPAIVPFIQDRLALYRNNSLPVIYLQDAHDPDDKEFEKFAPHCVAGTWGSAIIAELAPQSGEAVVPKKRFSGFYGTSLDTIISAAEAQTWEVTGVCTSICVMDTVGGLANRDYAVEVPQKGVADFDPKAHEFALKRMETIYGAHIR